MDTSDEILKLVRIVAGLPREDQSRILRLVDLMSLAPDSMQQRTQDKLRRLLDTNPQSKRSCVAGIDELIEQLERAAAGTDDRAAKWAELDYPYARGTTQ